MLLVSSRMMMSMERQKTRSRRFLINWGLLLVASSLLSQNLFVFPVFCSSTSDFQQQKNFYIPPFPGIIGSPSIFLIPPPVDPSTPIVPSPPIIGSSPPSYGSGGGTPPSYGSGGGTPPSYGSGTPPSHGSGGSTPPTHHTPTPSHGGGGGGHHHGKSPPINCGDPKPRSPPKSVDPSPPVHHSPSPAPPTYHYNPPSSGSTPTVPSPPILLPPMTPGLPFPSPPTDPNSPAPIGGPCDFWRNHPTIIWGLFGWYGTTLGSAFGIGGLPGSGANLNLVQALSNSRTDGIGALYREGTASLLNSMVNKHFPYTTSHVKDSFLAAVGSNKAAAAQARVFELANEGHMKLRV